MCECVCFRTPAVFSSERFINVLASCYHGVDSYVHTAVYTYVYSFRHEESTCLAYISATATSSAQYIRSELCLRRIKGKVHSPQYFTNHDTLKK